MPDFCARIFGALTHARSAEVVPRTGLLAAVRLAASGCAPLLLRGFARASAAHAFAEPIDPRAAHDVAAEERVLERLEADGVLQRLFNDNNNNNNNNR